MIKKNIQILIVFLFITGCDQDKKIILSDTWACPMNASLQTWDDGYPGENHDFKAVGCKTGSGDRIGYHVAWRYYNIKAHEGGFTNDTPSGEWSYFHKNGSLSSRGFFYEGKRDGVWEHWDNKGKFKYETEYKDGVIVKNKTIASESTRALR